MSLPIEGIALSVRHLVDEPENHVPVSGLARGHQDSKDDGDPRDEQTPWEPNRGERQQLGQRLRQCPDGRGSRSKATGSQGPWRRANRNASVPFTQRKMVEPTKTAKNRMTLVPKIVQKTSRYPTAENQSKSTRKSLVNPSAIRQDRDDDARHRYASPSHIPPSSYLPHTESLPSFQAAPAQSPPPGLGEKYFSNFPASSQ